MSSTQMGNERVNRLTNATMVDTKLEVVTVPVSDVERAKHFYGSLGWRLDADFSNGKDWRAIQITVRDHLRHRGHDDLAGLGAGAATRRR